MADMPTPKVPPLPFRKGVVPLKTYLGARSYGYAAGGPPLIQPWDLPRQGYLVDIDVFANGSVTNGGTAPTLQEDYPFSLTQNISLLDPAGNPIISETGYANYVRNLLLGARPGDDQTKAPLSVYSAPNVVSVANTVNFYHKLLIEVNDRDTLGTLPNGDPERNYRLAITAAPSANIFTANPPSAINIPYTPVVKFYAQPPENDPVTGIPYFQTPPHLGAVHRVLMNRVNITGAGPNAIDTGLQVGSVYRAIFLIFRSNGTRATYATTPFTKLTLQYGNNVARMEYDSEAQLQSEMFRKLGFAPPAGVYMLDFTSDSGLLPGLDGRRDYFNSGVITELKLKVDLPTGFNTANSWLEIISDTIEVPDGMTLM